MISNDHIVGFLVGVLYIGLIVVITLIVGWAEEAEDKGADKGRTEHWEVLP